MNPSIFREYDIRGVADSDLNDATLAKISRSLGTTLRRRGATAVALGRDCRLSSPRVAQTMSEGLQSTGLHVVDIGLVPTPLLYFAVHELDVQGGVMVTGSHNPPDYNGLKICIGKEAIFGKDILLLKSLAQSEDFERGAGSSHEESVLEKYLQKVTGSIRKPLNLRVAVDSGNGTGGIVGPELYRRLGCEVLELFTEPDGRFPNHHPDPTVMENITALSALVRKENCVVGIGFDGDADRIGVVNSEGTLVFGDELLTLFARQLLKEKPGSTVVSEVKASHRLFQDIEAHGGKAIQWKTGHSLIKAKMKESGALLAGEMSGHLFFKDRFYGFDDAIYAGARLIELLAEAKQSIQTLLSDLPPSFSTPEIRVDCPDEKKFLVVQDARSRLQKMGLRVNDIDGARVEFSDGWGLVRASNTQPVLVYRFEASTPERLSEIRNLVQGVVSECM